MKVIELLWCPAGCDIYGGPDSALVENEDTNCPRCGVVLAKVEAAVR